MRVVCPLLPDRLAPEAELALDLYAAGWERADVSPRYKGDQHGYATAFAELWSSGEDFTVVEHDIVIRADIVEAFESCEMPWCVFPYGIGQGIVMWTGLGCTRFRGALTWRLSELAEFFCTVGWKSLDREVYAALEANGHPAPHTHWPMVEHRHNHGDDTERPARRPLAETPSIRRSVTE